MNRTEYNGFVTYTKPGVGREYQLQITPKGECYMSYRPLNPATGKPWQKQQSIRHKFASVEAAVEFFTNY